MRKRRDRSRANLMRLLSRRKGLKEKKKRTCRAWIRREHIYKGRRRLDWIVVSNDLLGELFQEREGELWGKDRIDSPPSSEASREELLCRGGGN